MNDVREFSVPPTQLSCLIGNLFAELEPPCGVETSRISLASAQARKLTHSAVSPSPTKSPDFVGTPFMDDPEALTLCGRTPSGREAMLFVYREHCLFVGNPADLDAARNGRCPDRRCGRG
ncbi:hypothetical protein D3Z52_07910 [Clostridiaceae bacterium]|nr:hypothetical protein [Clostridiaceae bacterium]